jgi:glyoxylase-like metal-dependent hydrolase (beta-lactamase superfamily II)
MTRVHHLNCVEIESPAGARAIGHCLLLEDKNGLALVDAGIGLQDVRQPDIRLGTELIKMVGFVLREELTAYWQVKELGFDPLAIEHCIASHLDPDHIGGLADFPKITLHVSKEEYDAFGSGNTRYLPHQLHKQLPVKTYQSSSFSWLGLDARRIAIDFESAIYLVPLPGHTVGHCGVAIEQENSWLFYIGDAYYYRIELETDDHPVSQLAAARAEDNTARMESLAKIKELLSSNSSIEVFSYHDPSEFYQSI